MTDEKCNCRQCIQEQDKELEWFEQRLHRQMIVCQKCGNKRCPYANSHENECSGRNDPGQLGSAYP